MNNSAKAPLKKPREFWLIPYYDETGSLCWDVSDVPSNETTLKAKGIEDIHVMEKSAYRDLKAKADKLAYALDSYLSNLDTKHSCNQTFSISESNTYTSPLRHALKEYNSSGDEVDRNRGAE